MTTTPSNVALIGCGTIANAYFNNISRFPNVRLVGCCDLNAERARAIAAERGVTAHATTADLLADEQIDCVVNLTIPQAHAEIDLQAFAAGKHVFSEKPMALTYAEGLQINEAARLAGKRFGCAPDTVLGAGIQTARHALDQGVIGRPVAFAAAMQCGGHESWHPSPEFYYKRGGGPVFDMGPYYIHSLVTLLGPVESVTSMASMSFPVREQMKGEKQGQQIRVEVPTHVLGVLKFSGGVIGTLTMSFDVKAESTKPIIEIYGEGGTLFVPDPNRTNGEVSLALPGKERTAVACTHPFAEGARGLGVAEMMAAETLGRPHRANESIALHALEVMEALHRSAETGRHITLTSHCPRPDAMPALGTAEEAQLFG